ncbi:uncharacterized protein LOC125009675 [Mugil cephalus]|uniref:uncharacterized protein LOC125009675 n=1 Tax=Mugil cephalus TaxID=48193 RepID=UPI001FB70EC9|nr:uncharacterized protein LOC125009675 [Mugil cephalus]
MICWCSKRIHLNLFLTFCPFVPLSFFNWSKSALLHLNDSTVSVSIPRVKQFKYLGIEVFPSLNQMIKHNYSVALTNVLKNLEGWTCLPMSIQARISVIKMNILPRINFVSSMFPLSPPSDYWTKLQSAVSKFVWKGRRPRLKMSVLQWRNEDGGLSVPNFKLYFWSFVLRPLLTWFNPHTPIAWRNLESSLLMLWSLRNILFANISNKQCQLRFSLIVSYLIRTWRLIKAYRRILTNWHTLSPIFNNKALLIGGRPVSAPQWELRGVHFLKYILFFLLFYGLLSFSNIQSAFSLPLSSFFFYLQLRSALKAYGVPWHGPSGMVSSLYRFLVVPECV